MSKRRSKDTTNLWKKKAISRGLENKCLRKRIKEIEGSRDSWKKKYQSEKKATRIRAISGGEKAFGHKYSLFLVSLILSFHSYGTMSLRDCRHCISCLIMSLGLSVSIPSHTSIRNWLCKCGYYRVQEGKDKGGDYVVYLDESIVFGSEKMLLILGVSVANIPTDRSLTHSDMDVLYVGASQQWKGDTIAAELLKTGEKKEIKYVVSDKGRNLVNACKRLNLIHIEDCTHILANYLKRIYDGTEEFEGFRKLIGKLRKDWNLSKEKSAYMPPGMRGKMRFANIFPCVNWAQGMLQNWNNLPEKVKECLAFLAQNKAFIDSLTETETIFKTLCQTLKNQGFGLKQKQEILSKFKELNVKEETENAVFIQNCTQYLENLTAKSHALQQPFLLCSSDIIESYFGKFKYKINPNNKTGLTEFIFTTANFSNKF